MAIWNRALTAGEIATLFNGGTGVSVADVLNPVDTDEDGMPDYYENTNGLNPNVDDAGDDLDEDGLTNLEEFNGGTNPQSADTDDDGLTDGDELNVHSTDPVNSDSDADGLSDGEEDRGEHQDDGAPPRFGRHDVARKAYREALEVQPASVDASSPAGGASKPCPGGLGGASAT